MNYRTIGPLIELRNFKSNMQSQKLVMAIWNWSSGELCDPWASCFKIGCFDCKSKAATSEDDASRRGIIKYCVERGMTPGQI